MRVRNISKIVLYYVVIHRKHIGKTIVVHNLEVGTTSKISLGQRHDLISTTFRRYSNVMWPLGGFYYVLTTLPKTGESVVGT